MQKGTPRGPRIGLGTGSPSYIHNIGTFYGGDGNDSVNSNYGTLVDVP
jgi:hypothetical protein